MCDRREWNGVVINWRDYEWIGNVNVDTMTIYDSTLVSEWAETDKL